MTFEEAGVTTIRVARIGGLFMVCVMFADGDRVEIRSDSLMTIETYVSMAGEARAHAKRERDANTKVWS